VFERLAVFSCCFVLAFSGAAAASLLSVLPCGLRAADIDLYAWQFSENLDPADPKAASAQLIYGIPETDDIQVAGTCAAASADDAVPSITFGLDVSALQSGVETDLKFTTGTVEHTVKGRVQLAEYEEGLDGVVASLAPSDPLWTLMSQKTEFSYSVAGASPAKASLERGRENIGKFLDACRRYAAQATPPGEKGKP
jgi:hypothetical protein